MDGEEEADEGGDGYCGIIAEKLGERWPTITWIRNHALRLASSLIAFSHDLYRGDPG